MRRRGYGPERGAPLNAAERRRRAARRRGAWHRAPVPEGQPPKGAQRQRRARDVGLCLLGHSRPAEVGPSGKQVKLDKSDPNKYLIPVRMRGASSGRRRARPTLRLCELLISTRPTSSLDQERGRQKTWTAELLMVNALYPFSASYFAGNVKITDDGKPPLAAQGAAKPPKEPRRARRRAFTPKKPAMPARAKAEGRGASTPMFSPCRPRDRRQTPRPSPGPGARSTGVIQRQLTLSAIPCNRARAEPWFPWAS